jgi:hypothetical protein
MKREQASRNESNASGDNDGKAYERERCCPLAHRKDKHTRERIETAECGGRESRRGAKSGRNAEETMAEARYHFGDAEKNHQQRD